MLLEIVDYLRRKAYKGKDGFTLIADNMVVISALKTEDGLYIAERTIRFYEQLEVREAKSESEVLSIVGTWLSQGEKELVSKLKFDGLRHIDTSKPSARSLKDLSSSLGVTTERILCTSPVDSSFDLHAKDTEYIKYSKLDVDLTREVVLALEEARNNNLKGVCHNE
jgi:hypothetical protein